MNKMTVVKIVKRKYDTI